MDFEFDHRRDYGHQWGMMISKGKLKAKMLEYFREVERTGEPLIVTDHGRSVLEIRPLPQSGAKAEILAKLRTQLFGNKTPDTIESDLVMEPEWREEDEADDSWWTRSKPGA